MGTIARGTKAGGGTNYNSGQTISPTEVNDDFNTAYTEINGLLDDANVETATIPGAKSLRFTEITAPASPASNDVLLYGINTGTSRLQAKNSAGQTHDLMALLNTDVTLQEVVNTTVKTTVFTYTVPANTFGTTRTLVLVAYGDHLNNSGASVSIQIDVELGGTLVSSIGTGGLAASASRRATYIDVYISAANSATAQYARGNQA
ncbi:MAG: hypothetical protein ACRD2A_21315, partial [Vicinamibacterales bacterium]